MAMAVQKDVMEKPVNLANKDQPAHPEGMEHPDHRSVHSLYFQITHSISIQPSPLPFKI
jgi:hypothetical protein